MRTHRHRPPRGTDGESKDPKSTWFGNRVTCEVDDPAWAPPAPQGERHERSITEARGFAKHSNARNGWRHNAATQCGLVPSGGRLIPLLVLSGVLLALTACTSSTEATTATATEAPNTIATSIPADFETRCPEGFDLTQALRISGASEAAIIASDSGLCIASALVPRTILNDIYVSFSIRPEPVQEMKARCNSNGQLGDGCMDYPELDVNALLSTSKLGVLSGSVYLPFSACLLYTSDAADEEDSV